VFAEKRNDGPGDVGDHDLVLRRSRDQGRSWEPEQVVLDDGPNNCTDPTLALDHQRGAIWLFFLRDKVRFCCMSSGDSGRTWSPPRSIHAAVTRPEWDRFGQERPRPDKPKSRHQGEFWNDAWRQRYGVGPGWAAVQLTHGPRAGRILVPARHLESVEGGAARSFSHVFSSDDHGVTWQLGPNAVPDGNECRLVELADGRVMIHARDADNRNRPARVRRLVATRSAGGQPWGPAPAAPGLPCPQCHACVRRYSTAQNGGRDRLLFSNPNSGYRSPKHPYGRVNLTVRISYDDGATWTSGRTVHAHASSYSDMAVLGDGTIALVYERGPEGSTRYWDEIQFARFDLNWLTGGADPVDVRPREPTPAPP